MIHRVDIVTGVGYGDEGKGLTTNWLCRQHLADGLKPLVVRYGGGNQIGHTVMQDGYLQEHHHTGAGSLAGVDTFYSRFCTVDPIGTVTEINKLRAEGYSFNIYYDPRCMIVTPMDVIYNQVRERRLRHGSVGVGFGATVERNESHYRLHVKDIDNPKIFRAKYFAAIEYYKRKFRTSLGVDMNTSHILGVDLFYKYCLDFVAIVSSMKLRNLLRRTKTTSLVFEGHQGTLLDAEYGVFPNVTRSKTTCKNVFTILNEALGNWSSYRINISNYMITRCYHTRHGNGIFDQSDLKLKNNQWETNKYNAYQLDFKISELDMDLLIAGVTNNLTDQPEFPRITNNLVVTCCDQLDNSQEIVEQIFEEFTEIDNLYTNSSPEGKLQLWEQ